MVVPVTTRLCVWGNAQRRAGAQPQRDSFAQMERDAQTPPAIMMPSRTPAHATHRAPYRTSRTLRAALLALGGIAMCATLAMSFAAPAHAQSAKDASKFSYNPIPGTEGARPKSKFGVPQPGKDGQMLVQADRIDYDYNNERVAAVGSVQIYQNGATIQADRVTYDQRTKVLTADGNVVITEADGRVTRATHMNLTDDYRDGFVDSLRVETPERTRLAATRADRSNGNYTVFQSGVYTACEPCKDNPTKPPLWQVKAARIIHNQDEKMLYFEDARLEFFGTPIAYLPYFATPDPTVKRKSGWLMPVISSKSTYGVGVETPYYWALSPNYDLTLSPRITTRQGPLLQTEWRHRLVDGSYDIRMAGIFQTDKDYFLRSGGSPATPGYRDFRGSIETKGQFALNQNWVWGWDATLLTDRTFFQDYSLSKFAAPVSVFQTAPTEAISQLYLTGASNRSYFDVRAMHFYGYSEADVQSSLPVVHPVLDYKYVFDRPVLGGELGYRINLTSLTRSTASFDPITAAAVAGGLCTTTSANPAARMPPNCLLRGVPGTFSRVSAELNWRRSVIDPLGQIWTPFFSLRADAGIANVENQPGVANYITPGTHELARVMPTVGLEYRYPFISTQSWGTQTIEPIAQIIVRPNERNPGSMPNEDAQSLTFDDSNLFRVDKFSGWDRAEGGGRANVGISATTQFDRGGTINVLFGQSYHLFGMNSFAFGGSTNTGIETGLETTRSDYVGRVSYQPNRTYQFISRVRLDESTLTVRRFELEGRANFDRWNVSLLYGNYDKQPNLGFLTRREGILGTAAVKLSSNWQISGGARYDLDAGKFNQTIIGAGYVDDCFVMGMNYITDYSYSGNAKTDHRVTLQIGLRTLGGTTVSHNVNNAASTQ